MFAAFGPEEAMQVYGRGLRRRLPPMLDGDPRRVRMVYSLLFSLPGTPVLFYGEEIGMGEDLDAEGRLAVRTPMQWTVRAQRRLLARRSRASCPARWSSGGFAPEFVNVADQRNDPDSLLSFMKLLIRRYRESPELGWGDVRGARSSPCPEVLAHLCTWDDGALVAAAQPRRRAAHRAADAGGLRLLAPAGGPAAAGETRVRQGAVEIPLEGYGYRWLRVVAEDSRRLV